MYLTAVKKLQKGYFYLHYLGSSYLHYMTYCRTHLAAVTLPSGDTSQIPPLLLFVLYPRQFCNLFCSSQRYIYNRNMSSSSHRFFPPHLPSSQLLRCPVSVSFSTFLSTVITTMSSSPSLPEPHENLCNSTSGPNDTVTSHPDFSSHVLPLDCTVISRVYLLISLLYHQRLKRKNNILKSLFFLGLHLRYQKALRTSLKYLSRSFRPPVITTIRESPCHKKWKEWIFFDSSSAYTC